MLQKRLREWAAARGYGLAIADSVIVGSVRRKLEDRKASGQIDAVFFEENLAKFRYLEGSSIKGPKWVVMVAVPSPISVLSFTLAGRSIDALIPPTYVRYNAMFQDVLDDMTKNALGRDVKAEILKAPLKSLAVHMGLVNYGRNNITYAAGLGSYYQLCAYLVGTRERLAKGSRKAGEPETRLDRCATCKACLKACPNGAIREDRFLISAERCHTLLSESRRPIPQWARPPATLCLIGCMDCQKICPENKGRLKTVPAEVEFTAEEIEAVIKAGRRLNAGGSEAGPLPRDDRGPVWAAAVKKFQRLGMTEDLDLMGRNLEYFLSNGVG
jgi:epoxyqueuosine reductase